MIKGQGYLKNTFLRVDLSYSDSDNYLKYEV